jgi:hypothetical protein
VLGWLKVLMVEEMMVAKLVSWLVRQWADLSDSAWRQLQQDLQLEW